MFDTKGSLMSDADVFVWSACTMYMYASQNVGLCMVWLYRVTQPCLFSVCTHSLLANGGDF